MRRHNIGFFAWLIIFAWSATSYALDVSIDTYSITRDGSNFFTDTFNNTGGGPPTGPTNTSPNSNPFGLSYFVLDNTTSGTTSGTTLSTAESGGVLPLNSANGSFTANAIETPRFTQAVQVLSSITGGASQLGNTNVLSETGVFNLVVPTGPLFSAYGIRFTDNVSTRNGSGQLLQLFVRWNPNTNQAEVAYILQDFAANTITLLGSTPLTPPSGADQIEFSLSESTAGGAFSGSFEYLNGSGMVIGSLDTLGSGSLYDGVNYVRGQFFVAQGVPEPGSIMLLLSGLVALFGRAFWRSAGQ